MRLNNGGLDGVRDFGMGDLSQKVSGTKRNRRTALNATIKAMIQKTQRQLRDWMMAAETKGVRFLPPRRSNV